MQLRNSARGYGAVSLSLHWVTVGLVLLAWLLGTFDDELPRGAARSAGLVVHIWAGLAILALVALRIGWRLVAPPPPVEATRFGPWLNVVPRLATFAPLSLRIARAFAGVS